jgi:hypothetical protein
MYTIVNDAAGTTMAGISNGVVIGNKVRSANAKPD